MGTEAIKVGALVTRDRSAQVFEVVRVGAGMAALSNPTMQIMWLGTDRLSLYTGARPW